MASKPLPLQINRRLKLVLEALLSISVACLGVTRAEAALAFRSKSFTFTGTNVNTLSVTEPAGAAANDICFMFLLVNGTLTLNTPTGWTQVFAPYQPSTNGITVGLYWIRRGASAPTYTITWSGTGTYPYAELGVTCWSGAVTSGTPFEGLAHRTAYRGPEAAPDPPPITTTVANTLVIAFGMSWTGWATTATAPTGYTVAEGGSSGNNTDTAVVYKALATAGTEDPGWIQGLYSTNQWNDTVEATLALKPAGAAPVKVKHRVICD